jgi:hypothetical protein
MDGIKTQTDEPMQEMRSLYVDTRDGPAFVSLPGDVAVALEHAAGGEAELEAALRLAGLVVVRLGEEAGTAMLRHWVAHEPGILLRADPQLADALAHEPELVVGPLAGSGGDDPDED